MYHYIWIWSWICWISISSCMWHLNIMINNIYIFFHLCYISICRFKIIEEAVIASIASSLIRLSNPNLDMAGIVFDQINNYTTIAIHTSWLAQYKNCSADINIVRKWSINIYIFLMIIPSYAHGNTAYIYILNLAVEII